MIKFINILSNVISEQKRVQLDPETYTKLIELSNKLWSTRNKKYDKKIMVDQINFNTADGFPGLVKIFVNPNDKDMAYLDSVPESSLNPMDFTMDVNPKEYQTKKNLFLTLYHEMMHATDPKFTTRASNKEWNEYDPESNEKYWGHAFEFKAVTNEFLEALVIEFKRRFVRLKKPSSLMLLSKSLNNIINYFAKSEELTQHSLDILRRLNDEKTSGSKISQIISNIPTDYPQTSDFFSQKDEPHFLSYINLIKEYNPSNWPRFLTMLYKTKEEIEILLKKEPI